MEDGFRLGRFYGSYSVSDDHNSIGIELGFMDVPNVENDLIAHTFSISLQFSYFTFALGIIIDEYEY